MSHYPEVFIRSGCNYPYDLANGPVEPEPYTGDDKARIAVLGILSNLSDRRGIKWKLQGIDHDVRLEFVESLTEIVRTVYRVAME